jgi:hypothetical protein
MMVPAFIIMVPAFMVPDNRVSPCVEDPTVNEKSASRAWEVIEILSGVRGTLQAGSVIRNTQSLGSGYTVATDRCGHFSISLCTKSGH